VSTPRHLDTPPTVRRGPLATARGELAALDSPARVDRWAPAGEDNEASAPAPALLVPGFTGSKEDFTPLLDLLSRDGRRVVAIDQRGQFESPAGASNRAYDLADLAADLLAVVDAIGGPAHLVGHSFGGLVARAAVLADPTRVRSLTLLCSGPAALPEQIAVDVRLLVEALGTLDLEQVWTAIRALDVERGRPVLPPETETFLRRRFLANDPAGLSRFAEQLLGEPDRVEALAEMLAASGTPALVVTGEDDDRWPTTDQAQMAKRLGVDHVLIPDSAHSPNVENPEETARVLSAFWARIG
jgi:pimeloyl-ACP methyl ester carboxylesterase